MHTLALNAIDYQLEQQATTRTPPPPPTPAAALGAAAVAALTCELASACAVLLASWLLVGGRAPRIATASRHVSLIRASTRPLRLAAQIWVWRSLLRGMAANGPAERIMLLQQRALFCSGVAGAIVALLYLVDAALLPSGAVAPPAALLARSFHEHAVSPALASAGQLFGLCVDVRSGGAQIQSTIEFVCATIVSSVEWSGSIVGHVATLARQQKPLRALLDLAESDAYVYDLLRSLVDSATVYCGAIGPASRCCISLLHDATQAAVYMLRDAAEGLGVERRIARSFKSLKYGP